MDYRDVLKELELRFTSGNDIAVVERAWITRDEWEAIRAKLCNTKIIANDAIREIIEDAHMAGQRDAGVDPGYSNAQAYCDGIFKF